SIPADRGRRTAVAKRSASTARVLASTGRLAILATTLVGWTASPVAGQLAKKVLLIGIDGVRVDALARADTPHLDRLAAEGAFSGEGQTTRPTISGPAWSSMLTGVWPEKHGVRNNQFQNRRYDAFPSFLSRVEALRPELNTFIALDWLPLVSETSGGLIPLDEVDRSAIHDGYELGWAEADEAGAVAAVEAIASWDPDVAFVYLGNPDETSHAIGSIGPEYIAAIELADRHVGWMLDAVRSRDSYESEDWLVLVSTDHGRRADGGHGGLSPEEMTIFVLAHGPSVTPGTIAEPPSIVDVPVTALAHLGIEIDPAWRLDGRPVGLDARRR
ncbi:MAG: alkaline phosphatase family protein, partial [Gemmatimonadetes bacterium]|nr:alkaline phosphatase family protein [Gemmatimonadota bacterium]